MRLARKLEQRMEHLVEGFSAAVFRGRVHPTELADRLVRHIDRHVDDGGGMLRVPNTYAIRLHPAEVPDAVDRDELQRELRFVVDSTAMDRGWRLEGPTSVTVTGDGEVAHGRIDIVGSDHPGPLPAWGQLIDAGRGAVYDLTHNRVEIGRAPSQDVEIPDPKVSRHHATIHRQHGAVWLTDRGSSNGTKLNHADVAPGSPVSITAGDTVTFGPATFVFKEL